MKSDFEYGKVLKQRYLDSGLVASNAIDARESALMVYSSRWDRSLQSAQAVMRGMFGVRDELQTVPVHGAIRDMLDGWQNCPSAAEMKQSVRSDSEWASRKTEKLYLATKATLKEKFKIDVTLETWDTLYDWVQSANHSNVVEKALPQGMSGPLLNDIVAVGEWVLTIPFQHESAEVLGPLTGGVVLHDVLGKMTAALDNKEKASKMVVYSAHAANLMGLLRIFRLSDALLKPPTFGAALLLEVSENTEKNLVVTLRYNGRNWALPDCPDNLGDQCTLASFRAMFQTFTNESFVNGYWLSICDRDQTNQCPVTPTEPHSFVSFIPLWVVAGVLAGFLAAILSLLVLWKWYRNRKHRKRAEIILDLEIN